MCVCVCVLGVGVSGMEQEEYGNGTSVHVCVCVCMRVGGVRNGTGVWERHQCVLDAGASSSSPGEIGFFSTVSCGSVLF